MDALFIGAGTVCILDYPYTPEVQWIVRGAPGFNLKVHGIKKVFRYDSLIKIIPLIIGLTYCVNSGELLDKVPVLSAPLPRCGTWQGKAKLRRCSATDRIYSTSEFLIV